MALNLQIINVRFATDDLSWLTALFGFVPGCPTKKLHNLDQARSIEGVGEPFFKASTGKAWLLDEA